VEFIKNGREVIILGMQYLNVIKAKKFDFKHGKKGML